MDADLERAKEYFELAVEQRLNDAEFNLARILQETDPPSAIELYRRAADGGMAKAQLVLSDAYSEGIGGVVKNRKEAFKWCQKAAEQGLTAAVYKLGMLYFRGRGIGRDYEAAAEWLEKAAEKGHVRAQFYLGFIHDRGLGLAKNYDGAVK